MEYKTLKDVNFKNKKVILRTDFNVPFKIVDDEVFITDDKRITESLPTIDYILAQKPRQLIILAHLGRPKLIVDLKKFSLLPVYKNLEKKLSNFHFIFVNDPKPEAIKKRLNQEKSSKRIVALVENVRFLDIENDLESSNDEELAKGFASLADVFVFDGWGVAHRVSASVVGITKFIPESCLGLLVEKELSVLENVTNNPARPLVVIIGGAKVSDKIRVIKNILNFVDYLIIAGGLAFSFYKALGHEIGTSLVENNYLITLKKILKEHGNKIVLPIDNVVNTHFEDTPGTVRKIDQFKENEMGMDIGPYTIKVFTDLILRAKTIIWNGPVGVFEMGNFANGTKSLLEVIANKKDLYSFLGGGDTAAAAVTFRLDDKISFISTGGGVCLTYLEGETLKGIVNIQKKTDLINEKK